MAYYLHWSRDDLLDLDHQERRRYVTEISSLNTRIQQT